MARWEYQTLIYGTAERGLRRWVLTAADATAPSQPVGALLPSVCRFPNRSATSGTTEQRLIAPARFCTRA